MNEETVREAMYRAQRFIDSGKAVMARYRQEGIGGCVFDGCAETGACRRASMDLTRALAELRKPL